MKINAEELETVSSRGILELSKYEGKTAKIEKIDVEEIADSFEDGKAVPKLIITTEVVGTEKLADGRIIELRGSEVFNLKFDETRKVWGIPESPKSNIQKFIAKHHVKNHMELIGKQVIIRKRNEDYLGFFK